MNILFWGLTVSLIGKVLVVCGVLFAHAKIKHEHRIDKMVLASFRTEFVITVIGLLLIIFGYFLEIYFYHFADLLSCSLMECARMLDSM
jgi:hypothetical protein